MKNKILILMIALVLMLSACNSNKPKETDKKETEAPVVTEKAETEKDKEQDKDKEPAKEANGALFDLSRLDAKDIDGNKVDASIFKDKYTLVNIWGTFCNPCIVEMPDLQKINENLGGDKFQVIGIIGDTFEDTEENIDMAREVISKTGVKYVNIVPNKQIFEDVMSKTRALPTSFIVDSEGKLVGDPVFGIRDYAFFESWISTLK